MHSTRAPRSSPRLEWLRSRVGLGPLEHILREKTVPLHRHAVWYYFGGMTLFFFIVQVATGILLMLYYRPSAGEAYESVQFIMTQVRFGWLIRSIHSWSANLMVAAALVHLFSVLLLKSYRAPRELTWMSGFVLLVLAMGFGFSGYLLPWNTLAYFATRVGTDIAGSIPLVGGFILRFLRGGEHVTGGTLSRFYGWHVALLPAIATGLLGFHLMLVQRHGMSTPPSEAKSPKRAMPFVPDFLLRDLFGWTLALGVLGALAALFPWELGEKADPFVSAPRNIRPEWYFMFMFQTLKFVPGGSFAGLENEAYVIMGFALAGLVAFLVPFIDRGEGGKRKTGRIVIAAGWAGLLYMVVMTMIGYHAWWPAGAALLLTVLPAMAGRAMVRNRASTRGLLVLLAAGAALATASGARAGDEPPLTSCVRCHRSLEGELSAPAADWAVDIHASVGLGCQDCHGGDPSPALAEDPKAAMNSTRGFRPAPGRLEIPTFCARCHSDAEYMKRFNPQLRVDQFAEYRTSIHGKRNAAGDTRPAVCTDCHATHGIRAVSSPESPVYATRVPQTCAHCHADRALMAPYGIPTSQYDEYKQSVHASALLERGDVAAPACNDCHGNHGAAPPEATSVAHVCGQCHAREAILFEKSRKKAVFGEMGVAECTVCHGNHRIRHPTPELFNSDSAPSVSGGSVTASDPLVVEFAPVAPGGRASAAWRDVLRPHLPQADPRWAHRIEVAAGGASVVSIDATVHPGEPRLGARRVVAGSVTATLEMDPLSGLPVEAGDAILYQVELEVASGAAPVAITLRDLPEAAVEPLAGPVCLDCHERGDACDLATGRMHDALTQLDHELRDAAALLRKAEIAGMDVSAAQFELKSKGTNAAVEARAFIHAFDPPRLIERSEGGREAARVAHDTGVQAMAEVHQRRRGLAVSLILVGMVLAGLHIKIREIERRRGVSGPAA